MAPTSQKAGERPISFLLDNGQGSLTNISLVIRPEDLTRAEPSRAAIQQTLGGAWVDNFGPGLKNIVISGHTGWQSRFGVDGVQQFSILRDTVFTQWHKLRKAAVDNGRDPNDVKLIFADALDGNTDVVVPLSFLLKRNRARPLLLMYQINLIGIGELPIDPSPPEPGVDVDAGADSLADSASQIDAAAKDASTYITPSLLSVASAFLAKANDALNGVLGAVAAGETMVDENLSQLVGFADDIALVGRNAFYTYNAIMDIPDYLRIRVGEVAAAFDNAFCVLNNVFRKAPLYPDYTGLYGASNCSSTTFGDPLSPLRFDNAFATIMPTPSAPVSISADAKSSIDALSGTDPVLAPMTLAELSNHLNAINDGVTLI